MDEKNYLQDCYSHAYDRTSRLFGNIIKIIFFLFLASVVWMKFTYIPISTLAQGEIQFMEKTHKIETSTPMAIKKLYVSDGTSVKKGDPLVEFSSDDLLRDYHSNLTKIAHLDANIARLKAQAFDKKEPEFPEYLTKDYPELVKSQLKQFKATTYILKSTLDSLKKRHSLTTQELKSIEPLVKDGIIAEVKASQVKLKLTDIEYQLDTALKNHEKVSLEEMNEDTERLNDIKQQNVKLKYDLDHAIIYSPIDGMIKNVTSISFGEFVYPSESIMEIIPPKSRLITTASLDPADRGFIFEGQDVTINVDAYDSSLYGNLKGKIIKITSDSEFDEKMNKKVFKVTIASDKDYIEYNNRKLPIRPGMSAFVHIKTSEISILTYLFQPMLRTLYAS